MRRIFWDTMLLIYLLEGHAHFAVRTRELLAFAFREKDVLFTSNLALGELLAGVTGTGAKMGKNSETTSTVSVSGTYPSMKLLLTCLHVYVVRRSRLRTLYT